MSFTTHFALGFIERINKNVCVWRRDITEVLWASLRQKAPNWQASKFAEIVSLAKFSQVTKDTTMKLILNYRDNLTLGPNSEIKQNQLNNLNKRRSNISHPHHVKNKMDLNIISSPQIHPYSELLRSTMEIKMDSRTL